MKFLKEPFNWFLTLIRWTGKFHHQLSLLVRKILRIYTLYAWAFFSTLLPCEFIYSYFEKGCRKKIARDNPER